jgi:hypothetical protein
VPTSAVTGEGIETLSRTLFDVIPKTPAPASGGTGRELADYLVYRPRGERSARFRILRTDRGFLVSGRDVASVPRAEVEAALRAAGARAGDEVELGDELMELA